MATTRPLCSLPVATHPPTTPRMSEAEVLRFESMLEAADDAVQMCVEAQRKNSGWRAQEALCADAADAHLVAVLEEEGIEYDRPLIFDLLPLVAKTFDAHASVNHVMRVAKERDEKIVRDCH